MICVLVSVLAVCFGVISREFSGGACDSEEGCAVGGW